MNDTVHSSDGGEQSVDAELARLAEAVFEGVSEHAREKFMRVGLVIGGEGAASGMPAPAAEELGHD